MMTDEQARRRKKSRKPQIPEVHQYLHLAARVRPYDNFITFPTPFRVGRKTGTLFMPNAL